MQAHRPIVLPKVFPLVAHLLFRRHYMILEMTGIPKSQGNCPFDASNKVPITQIYTQPPPLYTITFPQRLDGLEDGLLVSSVNGEVLRPARASTTAGPGVWWRPTTGRLLKDNRR